MPRRLIRRWHRIALGGLVAMLVPVGFAHLADNAVPATYAGAAQTALPLVTSSLSLEDAHVVLSQENGKGYYHFNDMKATLSDQSHGVVGETIIFMVGQTEICRSQTTGAGLATCNKKIAVGALPNPLPLAFTATFEGDRLLGPRQATGALIVEAENAQAVKNNSGGDNGASGGTNDGETSG